MNDSIVQRGDPETSHSIPDAGLDWDYSGLPGADLCVRVPNVPACPMLRCHVLAFPMPSFDSLVFLTPYAGRRDAKLYR